MHKRTLIQNATIVNEGEVFLGSLLIVNHHIEEVLRGQDAESVCPPDEVINAQGCYLLPGVIDTHVHFRDPGLTHKADMKSESRAAAAGGVTTVLDMPNVVPQTTTDEALALKEAIAAERCVVNYGFLVGATNENAEFLRRINRRRVAAIKVFMGSSTGNMLVDKGNALEDLFSITGARILIHSEDEAIIKANLEKAKEKFGENIPMREHENIRSRTACIKSTIKALEMAMKHGTKLHVCHVTTAEEVEMIRTAKQYNPEITAETSANYLWFCNEDYDRLGSLVKCNPAIKTAADRAALRQAVKDGVIDTIGSDHAPHLMEEKQHPYLSCPSGMPSIQQEISVLLTVASQEDIPLSRVASLISEKTAELFGIEDRGVIKTGMAADLIIIDPNKKFIVGESDEGAAGAAYKCGWTPYKGAELTGMVEEVFLAGRHVVAGGSLIDGTPHGTALKFTKF